MNAAKHAPWTVMIKDRGMGHYGPFAVVDAKGAVICEHADPDIARLLAAAPEMLAALNIALADLTLNDTAARVVEDAIAKAEGAITTSQRATD